MAATAHHRVAGDAQHNSRLARELACLRGGINRGPETRRFKQRNHPERAAVIVTDTATGREATVSLYAASATMEALAALFPDDAEA